MADQEIRAEALKAAALTLLAMEPVKREQALNRGGKNIQENVIAVSYAYENFIRNGKTTP